MFDTKKLLTIFLICFLNALKIIPSCSWSKQQVTIGPSNASAGSSVAINGIGNIIVEGEPGFSSTDNNRVGRVQVCKLLTDGWEPISGFQGANTGDFMGTSVAIDLIGDIIAIGANGYSENRGLVTTYASAGNSWLSIGNITGENIDDQAGSTIALSFDGSILAEGEPGWNTGSGQVRIFTLTNSGWSGIGSITGANTGDNAGSAIALSLDGIILAEGEPGWSSNSGRIRTFLFTGGNWVSIGNITGENIEDFAGSAIALNSDGTMLAEAEQNYNFGNGRVRIFKKNDSTWDLIDTISCENNTETGEAFFPQISLSFNADGTILAIGEEQFGTNGTGRIRIFIYNGTKFQHTNTFIGQFNGSLGSSLSLNSKGNILAAGEPGYELTSGQILAFTELCSSQTSEARHLKSAPMNSSMPTDTSFVVNLGGSTHALFHQQNPAAYSFPTMATSSITPNQSSSLI